MQRSDRRDNTGRLERFEDLVVWRRAHELTLGVYHLTSGFPRDEEFGIVYRFGLRNPDSGLRRRRRPEASGGFGSEPKLGNLQKSVQSTSVQDRRFREDVSLPRFCPFDFAQGRL